MSGMGSDSDTRGNSFKYWAFISYSHQDKKWGDWLHRSLETYRLPRRLQASHGGDIPNRLVPIFRDREELPSSADLGQVIGDALQQSRSLIVICSPRSASSRWVNEEILAFKRLGRANRILSLIVDGEPNIADKPALGLEECFPPGLRFQMGPDGELSSEPAEPIAADVRVGMDGKINAKLKLIAGILGIGFDELKQRDLQRRQRQLVAITGSAVAIMAVTIGLAMAALLSRAEAIQQRHQAEINLGEARRQEGIANANEAEAKRQEGIAKDNEKLARAEKLVAQQQRFVAEFNLASRSYDEAQIDNVRELLFRQIPAKEGDADLRSFEWYYLKRLCERDLLTQKNNTFYPRAVATSPDGRYMAQALQAEKAVSVVLSGWGPGTERRHLRGHLGSINCVVFSPNGTRLATASNDRTVKIWDVAEAAEVHTLKGHTGLVYSVAFSPDGKRLATASSDKTVKLWSAETFVQLHSLAGHKDSVLSTVFSPDGTRLASLDRRMLKVWDATTFTEIRELECHTPYPGNLVYSPDGKRLAACSFATADQTTVETDEPERPVDGPLRWVVRVWDASTLETVGIIPAHSNIVTHVCFSPDGKRLATGSWDKTIKLWDVASLKPITTFRGHSYFVWGQTFHPDCRRLASAGGDYAMKIWDTEALSETYSPDLVVASTATSGTHPMWPQDVSFSADGQMLAAVGVGGLKVWNPSTLQAIADSDRISRELCNRVIAFSPDNERLAIADGNNVSVRDARTLKIIKTLNCFAQPRKSKRIWVGFSPDGKQLAATSDDNTVKLWDAANFGEVGVFQGNAREVEAASFSPDGKLLVTVADKTEPVRIWDVSKREETGAIRHSDSPRCSAFSTDGQRLAIGYGSGRVAIWNPATLEEVRDLRGHHGLVHCLAFSPDGKRLVTGSLDKTIKFWDTATLDEVYTLRVGQQLQSLAFSPDNRMMVTVDQSGHLQVWDGTESTKEERAARWENLEKEVPAWHRRQAEYSEQEGDQFAANYHRERLRRLEANNP
ncbi:MAG: TIR domain-containing protein [Planctomycetaceae bacterium]|nr:TIR domain-containing protein [Planctomycetales bacterium]MCB9924264.1 TIR domain-containing protein [Planctomycetaceae bacterium]